MTLNITGHCLCGSVSFECSAEPIFQGSCHCDDCRRSSGSLYGSFFFCSGRNRNYQWSDTFLSA